MPVPASSSPRIVTHAAGHRDEIKLKARRVGTQPRHADRDLLGAREHQLKRHDTRQRA